MFDPEGEAKMRWSSSDRRSDNIEDRRGISVGRGAAVGGGSVVIALVLALLGAPKELVNSVLSGGGGPGPAVERPIDPAQEPTMDMLRVILADTEDVWAQLLGNRYERPVLTAFAEAVDSACGFATSAVGPFYCPADRKVYLDLTFFEELDRKFGAPGDFAQAYVVAHEIGHHVQTLTGVSEKVHARRARSSEAESNALSVRQELQADCFAGVWGFHAAKSKNRLVPGDLEEGLQAATAIGDDTLQKRGRGHVVPESFTHGSAAQRVAWFKRGFQSGRPEDCDTFSADRI